jgi:UDP-N-acetylmuramate: L-alanyl-gamma-D-glutamyl-meso-diaminopimelate ligase
MLGEMIKDKIVIAVSGTHGKTSTSFMLCEIFLHEKIDIGYLVGGVSQSFDSSARLGSSKFFIIEADEYDSAFFDKRSKFIHYHSDTFIINNIEFDHADIFSDLDDIYKQFHHAVRTVPANGNVLIHKNDKNAKKLLDMGCWAKKHELGREDSISFNKSSILFKGEEFDLNALPFLGTHNYQNAIMAIYAAYLHGIHPGKSYEALLQFKGVKRRFEIIYQDENKVIIDDFAHHPTAISSTINAAKSFSGKKKILGIIELGSNTMSSGYHGEELFKSAEGLDKVLWLNLSKKIDQENVYNAIEPLLDELKKILDQYNVILIMSNKDSKKITEPIIEQIAH